MKKTENTKTTKTVENNDLQIIGKKFVFVINNDEQTEKTDTACQAFREWLKTPQNNKKYTNKYGIVGGDWQVDIADVTEFIHVATAQDSLSGGMVDVIYIKFQNSLLDRFVYLDNKLNSTKTVLLPIGDNIQIIPFDIKYKTTRKTTKKTNSTTTPTPTKTPKTEKTTKTTTKTPTKKTSTKTEKTTEKINGDNK